MFELRVTTMHAALWIIMVIIACHVKIAFKVAIITNTIIISFIIKDDKAAKIFWTITKRETTWAYKNLCVQGVN
jgi:hypothetical protein